LCERQRAIGADGVLILRPGSAPGRYGMVFVNADGLVGEMCGNGGRCLAAFIRRAEGGVSSLVLETGAGTVQVRFLDAGLIELSLPPPVLLGTAHLVTWEGSDWRFDAIDVGPPHVVCLLEGLPALEALDVPRIGRAVRWDAHYAPRGCNVNFATVHEGRLHLRTFERGVEDETLGCGTGAVAAVSVARRCMGAGSPSTVITRSGDALEVHCGAPGEPARLTGYAHFVFDGRCADDLLQGLAA
jgi:diaminopimelate epimerase